MEHVRLVAVCHHDCTATLQCSKGTRGDESLLRPAWNRPRADSQLCPLSCSQLASSRLFSAQPPFIFTTWQTECQTAGEIHALCWFPINYMEKVMGHLQEKKRKEKENTAVVSLPAIIVSALLGKTVQDVESVSGGIIHESTTFVTSNEIQSTQEGN